MTTSLRTRLSLTYILTAAIIVFLILVLTNAFVVKHFREYVKENEELRNKQIVLMMSGQYMGDYRWNTQGIETIGVSCLESGIILRVKDISGKVIWDAKTHNDGMCQRIITNMTQNSGGIIGTKDSSYIEIPYDININLKKVGTVEIGTYGSNYLNEHDIAFVNAFNGVLLVVGIFSLILALLLGTFMASRISNPISKVIRAAKSISKGFYSERITQKANTLEIIELTSTVNNLAESLEKQETLRKRLTADVAHELRTPLATLQSHIEAMLDGIWEADANRLQSCHDEITRISKMVGDLEKLTKYESESLRLEREIFDLSELTDRLVQNFQGQFQSKSLQLVFGGEISMIDADRDKISQVVINLLSNALKYTPEGGRVEVQVDNSNGKAKLIVKDNGIGIPKEDLPYIFERFYRADKSRTRMTGGAGIGLTICKAIVDAHGGTIEVESSNENGTKFIVSFNSP